MKDPVIDSNGHSFEKAAILKWIKEKQICPLNNKEKLTICDLVPNLALQSVIQKWREEQKKQKAFEEERQLNKITLKSFVETFKTQAISNVKELDLLMLQLIETKKNVNTFLSFTDNLNAFPIRKAFLVMQKLDVFLKISIPKLKSFFQEIEKFSPGSEIQNSLTLKYVLRKAQISHAQFLKSMIRFRESANNCYKILSSKQHKLDQKLTTLLELEQPLDKLIFAAIDFTTKT